MFNFNLQNKAFEELNAEQFRVVYLLNSTLSMVNKTNNTPNNNTIEMYNGYMMDKLGLSERQVQRLIKSIEEAGFINVKRAKAKKQPNKITINDAINGDKNVTLNNAIDCAVSEKNTNNAINGDKNGDKNVTLNKDEIKNNNITIPVEQGPVVIKTKKENKKPVEQIPVVIKEKKENEMNERSECNGMNATNGMSVVNGMNENEVKRNDAISSTTGNNNAVGKAYTQKVRPSSSETSNKATCDVQTPKMEQLPTEEEKVQQDAKEMPQTEREAKIASIMSNIELNKDVMLKAKSQMQFDAHFEDFKRNMANLKQLVTKDAYDDYRSTQVKWWKATVKYLIWYKDPNKKPSKPTKPTVEQMGNYQYHLDSMRIAQKIEDMENALNRMNNWFEKMEAIYTKTVMEQYWNKFKDDCASVKRSNPIFEEWQKKINQTIQ